MNGVLKVCGTCIMCLCLFPYGTAAQPRFRFSGQASGWLQYTPDVQMDFSSGGRYIPQFNYPIPFGKERLIDFEASANLNGSMNSRLFDSIRFDGKIKAYRLWARYSNKRMEVRAGLQKINFGSAQMFRPLMWFDKMDARDPLQLTDGIWGVLGRYYFLNNANIWFWTLYRNKDPKGYEITRTIKKYPEVGGRLQLPISHGEAALSYHYRVADPAALFPMDYPPPFGQVGEHKIGFDAKTNIVVGLWIEATWTRLNKNAGIYSNQEMVTVGADYTIGIGNGIAAALEQFIYSYDQNAFAFAHNTTFSAFSLSYPINAFDNISGVTYFNWTNSKSYFFLTWQKQMNRFSFYMMGFWNPKNDVLPGQGNSGNRFAGKGVQLMVVWNH